MKTDWAKQRSSMVKRQLRRRGICDPRVLDAFLTIPREEFVARPYRHLSYADHPLPIDHGQYISQPYICALMAECLELTGSETVLEVGSGSGFHAAVLGALAAQVVSIELIPELTELARENLRRTGRDANVIVIQGDGSIGHAPRAPYDAISVAAAATKIPPLLLEQLKDPGRLVIPVGDWPNQALVVVLKQRGEIARRVATTCSFVPLLGG